MDFLNQIKTSSLRKPVMNNLIPATSLQKKDNINLLASGENNQETVSYLEASSIRSGISSSNQDQSSTYQMLNQNENRNQAARNIQTLGNNRNMGVTERRQLSPSKIPTLNNKIMEQMKSFGEQWKNIKSSGSPTHSRKSRRQNYDNLLEIASSRKGQDSTSRMSFGRSSKKIDLSHVSLFQSSSDILIWTSNNLKQLHNLSPNQLSSQPRTLENIGLQNSSSYREKIAPKPIKGHHSRPRGGTTKKKSKASVSRSKRGSAPKSGRNNYKKLKPILDDITSHFDRALKAISIFESTSGIPVKKDRFQRELRKMMDEIKDRTKG